MNRKQETTFLARIKERVDFIYGLLIECPEGYHGGLRQDGLTGDVARSLIKRGIVKREKDNTRARLVFVYKWIPALAPTKALYTNVMVDVREARKEYEKKTKENKRKNEPVAPAQEPTVPAQEEQPIKLEFVTDSTPLEEYTDNELWDELKRRGYTIEGNRLVVTIKQYLE